MPVQDAPDWLAVAGAWRYVGTFEAAASGAASGSIPVIPTAYDQAVVVLAVPLIRSVDATLTITAQPQGIANAVGFFTYPPSAAASPPPFVSVLSNQIGTGTWTVTASLDGTHIQQWEFYVFVAPTFPTALVTDNGAPIAVQGTITADTELPAAVVLGDALANPTTPLVGAAGLAWDATNNQWVRLRGLDDATDAVAAVATETRLATLDRLSALNPAGTWDRLRASPNADGTAPTGVLQAAGMAYDSNAGLWSRPRYRAGQSLNFLPSASRSTTQAGANQDGMEYRGIYVYVSITAIGTGSITVAIQASTGAGQVTILASAALVANGTTILRLFPGATPAANLTANDVLPARWRLLVTANNANPVTYSVDYHLVP